MKIFSYKLIGVLAILFMYCTAMKNADTSDLRNGAIKIAVNDFFDNCNLLKTDSVFSVSIYIDNDDILGLSILGVNENKIYPSLNDKIGDKTTIFPSHYIEKNNKLIYWGDSISTLSEDIVKVLSRYNQIDSTFVNEEQAYPDFVIDESIKGAHYYFCKNNLAKFKRVITNKAMGWYAPPKLKCKGN